MALGTELHQRLEQRMKLTQQLVQSLELLQLPILELRDMVNQELSENPTLEVAEDIEEKEAAQPEYRNEKENSKGDITEKLDILENFEDLKDGATKYTSYSSDDGDDKLEMMQSVEAKPETLQEHLYRQLALLELTDEQKKIGEFVISNINDDGYLTMTIDELVASLKVEFKNVTEEELRGKVLQVINIVQKFEPRGVGCRDLRECLLLQLDEDDQNYQIKKKLITEHINYLTNDKLEDLSKEVDVALDALVKIVAEISQLKLKPGSVFSSESIQPIYPEVTVKEVDGNYEIFIEDTYLPALAINKSYEAMIRSGKADAKVKEFIRQNLTRSKWLISAIEQRKTTLYKITSEIIKRQREFLEKGIEYLKPLTMMEIADTVGVNVSTVSRACSGKYIDTSQGVFNMKFFFASASESVNSGTAITKHNMISKLKEIIDSENKKEPLSDFDLAEALKKADIKVARRTVAKLREELNIPPARMRKQLI